MKLRPLGDKVILKRASKEEVTKTGILLPDASKERPEEGEILAVGPGKMLDNGSRSVMNVKVGDRIVFKKYSDSQEVKVDGEEYLVLSESDIMAVIE